MTAGGNVLSEWNGTRPYLNPDWLRKELAKHGNPTQVALANGFPPRTIRRAAKNLRELGTTIATAATPSSMAAAVREMDATCPITFSVNEIVVTGRGVVSSDWHLPLTDYERVARLIETAIRLGCTDYLLIVGDYLNLDWLSRHDPKQEDAGLEVEMDRGGQLIAILLEVFDRVVVSRGNHDERAVAALGWKMRFEASLRMLLPNISPQQSEKLEVTGLDYILADTDHGRWLNAHTSQYSKVPLAVPRELCDIHQMHVAAGHRHHHAIGKSKGGYYAVETGGLFDASKTAYLKRWTTTFPKWTPGWLMLHEAGPYLPELAPAP